MQIGLKLWSINDNYLKPAQELYNRGLFDFIELMTVPGSYEKYGKLWQNLDIPFGIHAPHSYAGLNFSLQEKEKENIDVCRDVFRFFDLLKPAYIVFHPGIQGTAFETIRQINNLKKSYPLVFQKALIENKPMYGLKDEKCIGASPMEIHQIMDQTSMGFCLDFGHAYCYAATIGNNGETIINDFLQLKPKIYHVSDGQIDSDYDDHLHIGKGTYNISWLKEQCSQESKVIIETDKDYSDKLDDFIDDVYVFDPIRFLRTKNN